MGEKGQITLPVAWRSRVGTTLVRVQEGRGDMLEIVPIQAVEDDDRGWVSIFSPGEKKPTTAELLSFLRKERLNRTKKRTK